MGSEEKQMQSPVERKEIGSWLREQREAHCWSRPEMARQLIRAAHAASDRSIVDVDNLCHNIYRWERGAVGPANDTGFTTVKYSASRLPHSAAPPKQQRPVHWSCRAGLAGKWESC
jgi:hypothetical protein